MEQIILISRNLCFFLNPTHVEMLLIDGITAHAIAHQQNPPRRLKGLYISIVVDPYLQAVIYNYIKLLILGQLAIK